MLYIEYSQPFILSTVLYIFLTLRFTAIQFYQRTFFQRISEHQPPWNKFLIEAAVNIDYTEMRAATWSSYIFAKIIF